MKRSQIGSNTLCFSVLECDCFNGGHPPRFEVFGAKLARSACDGPLDQCIKFLPRFIHGPCPSTRHVVRATIAGVLQQIGHGSRDIVEIAPMEGVLIQGEPRPVMAGLHPSTKHRFTIAASFWREHIVQVHDDFILVCVCFFMAFNEPNQSGLSQWGGVCLHADEKLDDLGVFTVQDQEFLIGQRPQSVRKGSQDRSMAQAQLSARRWGGQKVHAIERGSCEDCLRERVQGVG